MGMGKRLVLETVAVAALIGIAGCAGNGYYGAPGYSGHAPAPTDAPKKEQRGNTPIGMDRTGAGPADGAILDPTGAVSRPVIRER
jgi:hypothetical protein